MSDTNMSKDKPSLKPAASDQAAGAVPPSAAAAAAGAVPPSAAGAEAAAQVEVEDEVLPEKFMSETEGRSRAIVQSYVGWASAAGLLPVPVLDVSAILGIQIAMLKSVAAVYGVPFNRRMVKPLLVSLVNAGSAVVLAAPAASLVKFVPFLGSALGMLTLPALSSASCYATGRVFIAHFESGGTFLDFDPASARAFYANIFSSAQKAPAV